MGAGRRKQDVSFGGGVRKQASNRAHLRERGADVLVHARRRFEHGGHELLPDPLVACGLRDLVETRNELEALRRDELELLLDAEAEQRALAEGVLYGGSVRLATTRLRQRATGGNVRVVGPASIQTVRRPARQLARMRFRRTRTPA